MIILIVINLYIVFSINWLVVWSIDQWLQKSTTTSWNLSMCPPRDIQFIVTEE